MQFTSFTLATMILGAKQEEKARTKTMIPSKIPLMAYNPLLFHSAKQDFNDARLKATMQEVLARLTGTSIELLPYEEVARKLKLRTRTDRGVKVIPLDSIVGSVGRYTDFTRSFLPRRTSDRDRWARVKAAMTDPAGTGLPPIEVYKVGEAYFVLDGNHRVSIARQERIKTIEAHVFEIKTDIPVTPALDLDSLIIKAEYADFLEETGIMRLRPNVDLSVTAPGQYPKLLEHIEVHRHFMGLELQRKIPYSEAVTHWYDTIYLPFIEPIRERDLLHWFPGRTETDLYLWVSEHRATLEKELEWSVRPVTAVENLVIRTTPRAESVEHETGAWRKSKLYDRYIDRLFNEILVPVEVGKGAGPVVEQSILVAKRESATLHGLHVVATEKEMEDPAVKETQAQFTRCCQEAGIPGKLVVKVGKNAPQIHKYAHLTDLVVLNVSHPPGPGLNGLGSGLRTIIHNSPRPILTLKGEVSQLASALVAFDGSLKSREALFLATYLAERWGTALTVLTIEEPPKVTVAAQDYARTYLELHEMGAKFVVKSGSPDAFLEAIQESESDLVVMGGYSGMAMQEVVIGSAVNFLLRKANVPIFICR
jgi:nucleotide-binding universal stress UspA family protein